MPTSRKEEFKHEETSPKRIKLAEAADSKSALSFILEKEIRNEINIRKSDLETIEQRIYQTRQSLVKLRQGIVAEFYKQNTKQGILQAPPHPAIKDTFHGKSPAKNSTFNVKEEQISEVNRNISDTQESQLNGYESNEIVENQQFSKIPRYIPPKYRDKDVVQLCEPRGNVKKKKFRISIVNISKWIFDEQREGKGATHKWTVYVKNCDPEVDITSIISKVTFFLHNSYKPNDVITVEYFPFKLTRRGWGEFPLRVQLHFINSLDKPVDVIHELKLDTTLSGLDTFGSETVVDIWAHCNENEADEESSRVSEKEEPTSSFSSCIDQLTTSPDRSATYPSDEYLSASSLSQLSLPSLPTEISNDILSEIFGDNEDEVKIKEELKEIKYDIRTTVQNDNILSDFGSSDIPKVHKSVFKEEQYEGNSEFSCLAETSSSDFIQNIEVTSFQQPEPLSNENVPNTTVEYQLSTDILCNSLFTSVRAPKPELLLTEQPSLQVHRAEHLTNNTAVNNKSTEKINDMINDTSKITYNPIECLNFVSDEVIITSEDDEEERNKKKDGCINNLSCQNYLDNFVDIEIQNGDEQIVKQEIIVTDEDFVNSEEVPNIEINQDDLVQQSHVKELLPFIEINEKNFSVGYNKCETMVTITGSTDNNKHSEADNITHNTVQLSSIQVSRPEYIKVDHSTCLNKKLPASNNKSGTIKLADVEHVFKNKDKNVRNKFIVKDVNKIKNLVVSPIKYNVDQKTFCKLNVRNSKIEELIKNKSEAIILVNNDEVTDLLSKNVTKTKTVFSENNVLKLGNNSTEQSASKLFVNNPEVNTPDNNRIQPTKPLKKKLFIEMPNGELREICSGMLTSTNESKLAASSVSNKPIIIESQSITNKKNKVSTVSGKCSTEFKQLKSINTKKMLLNPAYKLVSTNQQKIKLNEQTGQNVCMKIPQKSKQSLLKAANSGETVQTTMKSGINVGNSSQIIRIVGNQSSILDSTKITVQRKVLPGESLLKKGNTIQQVDTAKRQDLSTSLSGVLSEKQLIKRCPSESIEFAISWLIKHLPLVNEKAGIEAFKTKHPYCANDRVTFLKWPLAKQRAAEMMRAKKISRLLTKICPQLKKWKTLQIIDWARLRGYTPLGQPLKCNNLSAVNGITSFVYTAPDLATIPTKHVDKGERDIDVDIESGLVNTTKVHSTLDGRQYIPLDKRFKDIGDYIFKSCDNIGVHFYEEELIPGVIHPAAERALICAFNSVVDDLFRRSLNASCMRTGVMPANEILLEDVKTALLSRSEFDIFTNEGLGISFTDHKDKKNSSLI